MRSSPPGPAEARSPGASAGTFSSERSIGTCLARARARLSRTPHGPATPRTAGCPRCRCAGSRGALRGRGGRRGVPWVWRGVAGWGDCRVDAAAAGRHEALAEHLERVGREARACEVLVAQDL